MNIEDDFVAPVLQLGDRLGDVDVGENHRGCLSGGHLDLTSLFHALDHAGPITFESFSSAVVSSTLADDLAGWRDLWDDGPAVAHLGNRAEGARVVA